MELPNSSPARRTRRKQLHVWLTEREYVRLQELANTDGEPLSVFVRRALKMLFASRFNPSDGVDSRRQP
jgi:hypothetical protein